MCLLPIHVWAADPVVEKAQQLEKAGDPEGAAKVLSTWLAANPGSAQSSTVFDVYMRTEGELPTLLEESARFLKSGKGVPGAAAQFERIARLYDLAGRVEEARDAYVAAHAEGAPDSTLVSAFLLSMQMNDTSTMAATVEQISAKGGAVDLLLRALSDTRSGDRAAAHAALVGLADQTGNPEVALKALWVLYQAARDTGDAAGQASARSRLTARFSGAPETALASGPIPGGSTTPRAVVVQMPAPGPFESAPPAAPPAPAASNPAPAAPSPPAPDTAPPAPSAGTKPSAVSASSAGSLPPASAPAPATDPSAVPPSGVAAPQALTASASSSPVLSVQAGSFLMKENADDLVSELSRRGFSAVVVHDVTQGKDRYRVLAAQGLGMEAAKAVLQKLSDSGFRGYLVQEK
jgi:acylphosphatase